MGRPRILANPLKRYHGIPCEKGHTERYRSNNRCVECLRAYKASQYKKTGIKSRTTNFADKPKVCGMCKQQKPPEDYYKTRFGTLRTDCIACLREYQKEMYRSKYKWLGKPMESVLT